MRLIKPLLQASVIRLVSFIVLSLLIIPVQAQAGRQNQLVNHPSPYLAMHGDDPVHWQEWGEDVLALARKEDKLLFISSGYFSCHWCHVMQNESYRDQAVADLINEHYIPVKIDRELEPALDAHLIDYVERTQGHAGWPLNVFVTPEGYPLIGMTYKPKEDFQSLLTKLQFAWISDRQGRRDLARRVLLSLQQMPVAHAEVEPASASVLQAAFLGSAMEVADTLSGGFGQQSRFPMTPHLLALLGIQGEKPSPQLGQFLELTLKQMSEQGMMDQLAGGFFRYTIDPDWQTPHYEKMLYTQALLAEVYLNAAKLFNRPEYNAIATRTLDFVLQDLQSVEGGYISSTSAVDDKGEEGAAYLWTQEQLQSALDDEELVLANRRWSLYPVDSESAAVLPRLGETVAELAIGLDQKDKEVADRLEVIRQKLLERRKSRSLPLDDKVLTGWNGLLLAALSDASAAMGSDKYRHAALALKDYMIQNLWRDDVLLRSVKNGQAIGVAALEDYAFLAYGLSRWLLITDAKQDRAMLKKTLTLAWDRFYQKEGWRNSDQELLPGMARSVAQTSGPMPAPSALIIQLSLVSGDPDLEAKAIQANKLSRRLVQEQPFWYPDHAVLLFREGAKG